MRPSRTLTFLAAFLLSTGLASANLPGGGSGTGPAVTLVNNGNGTVTMANGIISVIITTADASIHTLNYTYNNGGGIQNPNLLTGGNNGGQLYWTGNPASFGTMNFTYSLVTSSTNYIEIALTSPSTTNGVMEIHYSMLRGSSGFYTTAILTHRPQDDDVYIVMRPNIYSGAIFNWMSVDAARNRLMEVSGGLSVAVQGAPKECTLWTNGIYAGQYEDKYKYSADLYSLPAWGWSSVGTGGKNFGLWNVTASPEYYPGGPLERSLMEHLGTTILNVFTGGYYGLATDATISTGETWSKTYGPYFYYCNNVTNTLTSSYQAAQALYNDALAQGAAEQSAWPYAWFTNANYTPASGRGTITGQFTIADSGNPNASAAGLWVGAVQQPDPAYDTVYDFQQWARPYQFWVKTDTNGSFTIPNVIAGGNYTLYAFGPGAAGTFMSQNQTGGSPPPLCDLPASPFSVTVTGGATNNLGAITWTPTRVGATVFEIGYPDRTAAKFRHGDDYWVGDIGPTPTAPSPIWSKWLEFPFDFPNGLNYVVGQNRWSTDWNFIQPVTTDSQGNYNSSSSTITFNLPSPPANGAHASLYLGLTSDYYAAIVVSVNGINLGGYSGVTGTPNNIPSTGYTVAYGGSDTSIREGNNGAFCDERINFPTNLLHLGANTININFRQVATSYFANHFMYDYVRLELSGYVPPPPANITAYAGNNAASLVWPVTPGATSYNILRSTTSGSGYLSITNGVIGPVCGSGFNNATYLDNAAANGMAYYYVVRSVNPTGSSTNSPQTAAVTPLSGITTSAPAAPTGLLVSSTSHQTVNLSWTASAGANYYSVWRSALVNTGGGSSNTLSTIILGNSITNTSYTDASPTDGTIYRYFVTATSPGGTSGNSAAVIGVALPAPPASLPVSLTAAFTATNVAQLNWTTVSGAIGYAIYRATSAAGPFTFLQSVTETTYYDSGISSNTIYYYRVAAVNGAGVSANATDSVNSKQVFPPNLSAAGSNAQVTLTWPATTGAISYNVKRGTSSGNETLTVATGIAGTSYTNVGLANGTTYYYVVTATGTGGSSGNSPEASATPFATSSGIWAVDADGNWGTSANWNGGGIATGPASTADFSTLSLTTNRTVTLDTPRTISGLKFGDTTATFNWTIAGTNTLTLGASPNINVVNDTATINTAIAGSAGLAKNGAGTLTIGGATNTVTGGTTINAGNLTLDYSVANSPVTNLLPAANALVLGGGKLQVTGSSNTLSSQTFASTALNAGLSVISAAPAAGLLNPTITLGTVSDNAGGALEFIGPATVGAGDGTVVSNAAITTAANGNSAFVNNVATYATVGLYDFAAATVSTPYAVIGASQVSGYYTAASGGSPSSSGNLDVTGNITGWSVQPYLGSIRCNASLSANQTIALANKATTLTLPDILITPNIGAYNVTFTSGNIRPSTGSGVPLFVWQNNVAGELILLAGIGNSSGGNSAYVQNGPGTVSLTVTTSGYSGQSYLNGGVTMIAGNGSLGAVASGSTVNLNGGTVLANGTFALDNSGSNLRPVNLLANGGGLAATAGNTLTVDGVIGSAANAGPLTIGIPASTANGNIVGLMPGTGSGTANPTPVNATGIVVLTNANYYFGGTVLQSGTLNFNGLNALGGGNYGGLTFNGGTLQYAINFTGLNGSSDLTSIGTAGITFAIGGGTVDLNGNAVTYAGSIGNNGIGALKVKSTLANASLNLQGANAYNGNTTVTNVTLLVNNLSGSATGAGDITIQNGATFSGGGAVAGSVIVATGGTLAPNNLPGDLNIGNNLTLAASSKTLMQIQHSPLANDNVVISGTLNAGGTLTVTNLGGALTNGDSFMLFNAANYSGTFNTLILPSLAPGLFWNTNQLSLSGILSVAAYTPPAIGQIVLNGDGTLGLAGSGGIPYWNYYVLASTNLMSNWIPIATNHFNADGTFNWTGTPNANAPQQFYQIKVP